MKENKILDGKKTIPAVMTFPEEGISVVFHNIRWVVEDG